jgi:hypothetical protein
MINYQEYIAFSHLFDDVKDIVKAKQVEIMCSALTQGYDLHGNDYLDPGYTFICWQMSASTRNWTADYPIYIEQPLNPSGFVFWAGTLVSTEITTVRFILFERKIL